MCEGISKPDKRDLPKRNNLLCKVNFPVFFLTNSESGSNLRNVASVAHGNKANRSVGSGLVNLAATAASLALYQADCKLG